MAYPDVIGSPLGTLPGVLTISNAPGLNDYFHGFTFGTSFQFRLVLDGPGIQTPDGISSVRVVWSGIVRRRRIRRFSNHRSYFVGTVDIDRLETP